MKVFLKDIAKIVNGDIVGDENTVITGPAKIEEAGKNEITFLANPKYEPLIYSSEASALIVATDFEPKEALKPALLKVKDVYQALSQLLDHYGNALEDASDTVIHKTAVIDSSTEIDQDVSIGANAIISSGVKIESGTKIYASVYLGHNVKIGKNCTIHPGVRIYANCTIDDDCIIHSNTVIGADGFGFAPTEDGSYKKIQQVGNVVIHRSVEIGANCCIDRATMGSTIIETGVKIDNLVQIAHNVFIGAHTVIASQAGIAGSARIGKNCLIGGQVGIVGHINIADGTKIQAQSGVSKSTTDAVSLYGSPALNYSEFQRSYVLFKNLPDLASRIRKLEKALQKS